MIMRIIQVLLNNQEVTTIYWYGKRDSLDDIRSWLISHDKFDDKIVLEEIFDEAVIW